MLPFNTNGVIFTNEQLQRYMENMASEHILMEKSNPNTFPIPRLRENFNYITKTYELLNLNLKSKIMIHPARRVVIR